ncbi:MULTISPECIES: phosphoribosyltransferase [unclassified Cyanobium]|uniref:phosphoribosyltransferase n=1 Tax=unclassified Cyanobium TaxID=2627006 RepID=UPI0020CB6C5E|nr:MULTISPECIES: phosphoribosyltransferase family protein [unclassified Cyanobium]MCP9858997.1 phosphoribosyltransferase [Cyanobium sp. Cruz-8H5]MCP9866233.1 phosphoribosyltransferase [Cyanobium sp. Cruz-8D1]
MVPRAPLWTHRHQAGMALADAFADRRGHGGDTTLVALPRGGVPVAAAMASRLALPLVSWSVRKVADPRWPELAIGAVAAGGVVLWRNGARGRQRATTATEHGWLRDQELELQRRQRLFGDPPGDQLRGRHLIVVDDGIATGMTVKAALLSLRRVGPASLALAVPVVDREVAGELGRLVDRMEALAVVSDLQAVGSWYENFEQLSDRQVLTLLQGCGAGMRSSAPAPPVSGP